MFIPRRLVKYVRDATPLSVQEIEALRQRGHVRVVGSEPRGEPEPVERLIFEDDVVLLRGEPLLPRRAHHTIVLNKPRAVTTTVRDPRGKRDLTKWIAEMPEGTFPIGRLDRDTTGLLLLTTDGDLCSAITRPEHHTDKVYWLWLNEQLLDDDPRLLRLTSGVAIRGRDARAKSVAVHHRTQDHTELLVTLNEGRNRQIRRMCRALDLRLLHLHRRSVGALTLDGVEPGAWRLLNDDEVERLWKSAGGRHRVVERQVAALEIRAREAREAGRPHTRLEAWLERNGRSALRSPSMVIY